MNNSIIENVDDEIERYNRAQRLAEFAPPLELIKNKTVAYNKQTGANEILLAMQGGGYVKVGEMPKDEQPLAEADAPTNMQKELPVLEGFGDKPVKEFTKSLVRGGLVKPAKFLEEYGIYNPLRLQILNPDTGELDLDFKILSQEELEKQRAANQGKPFYFDIEELVKEDEEAGIVAGLAGGLGQFLGAYVGLAKFFKFGQTLLAQGFTRGAAADFLAFEGNEGRLTDILVDLGVDEKFIPSFLVTDPNDPDYVGRFKTAFEGGGLGIVAEGVTRGVGKLFRAIKDRDVPAEEVQQITKDGQKSIKQIIVDRLNQPGEMPTVGSMGGNIGQNKKKQSFYVNAREGGVENENAKKEVLLISQGNKPKVENLATYFEQNHKNIYGRQLDPNNDLDFDLALNAASDEVLYQLDQAVSGKGWYDSDVKKTFETLSKTPGLKVLADNETMRVLWSAMAAPTSIGNKVSNNTKAVTAAFLQYLKTGKVPVTPPQKGAVTEGIPGAGWGLKQKAVASGMRVIAHLVETKGVEGFADWWLSPHTLQELTEVRKAAGLGGAPAGLGGGKDSIHLGAMVLGDKTGRYSLNINGYQGTTKDVWFARSYNRHFGNMYNPDGTLAGQPRNLVERRRMEEFTARLVDKLSSKGLSEQDAQAVLWFYEQNLFTDLGVVSRPGSFSETAEKIANDLRSGVRPSNATQTGAQSTDAELTNFRSISAPKRTVRSERRSGEVAGEAPSPYTRGSGEGAGGDGLLVLNPNEQTQRIYSEVGISLPKINETQAAETATQYNADMTGAMSVHTFGAQVEIKSADELADARLFRTENGSGFAIKPDGDIVAVFQSGNETGRVGYSMMQAAIAAGGKKLDAFDTFLSGIYETTGFKPVARVPWNDEFAPDNWDKNTFKAFNNGEPDVILYVYDPNYFGGATDVPKFTNYDDAVAAQNAELSKLENKTN